MEKIDTKYFSYCKAGLYSRWSRKGPLIRNRKITMNKERLIKLVPAGVVLAVGAQGLSFQPPLERDGLAAPVASPRGLAVAAEDRVRAVIQVSEAAEAPDVGEPDAGPHRVAI